LELGDWLPFLNHTNCKPGLFLAGPERFMRAFRLPLIAALLCAFAVSGCMRPAAPIASAYAAVDEPYRLDAGDRLRIVVYGQEGLTNTYTVDAGGAITCR
jgi:polysaccharide export outer membrane protein